ncbi:DUF1311 domain-containing protein [Aliarcobacter cryaerophilus]|uniref:lysozyme inhibitor LprI family protein n=1 Tax=Aliarcobacter cryaerophilus TaxID=28198 RepID=UPI0021B4E3B8|nr:lysozyme inhibitor LprI family protein [Aliarcobacter cryaerophilus]MCT7486119.1 DUF1311 domain-containing protein [Aliarcobacter cryaerophilus]MCT7491691.1 DUF1311 domain-containing protein [Aliarcobacter cryaerophilus]
MKKIIFILLFFVHSLLAFEQKDVNDLKRLDNFTSIDEFEKYYESYIQKCLDSGYGGTGSIPCYSRYELWDRELNLNYLKLISKLNKMEIALLNQSQKKWLESRDLIIKFNSLILDKSYKEEGTMFLLMRAEDADYSMSLMIKERALMLKKWYERIK